MTALSLPRAYRVLGVVDWISTVMTGALALLVQMLPLLLRPMLVQMFQDMGVVLPSITLTVLAWWPCVLAGLLPPGLLALALLRRQPLAIARVFLAAALLLATVELGMVLLGFYAPVWQVASAVK